MQHNLDNTLEETKKMQKQNDTFQKKNNELNETINELRTMRIRNSLSKAKSLRLVQKSSRTSCQTCLILAWTQKTFYGPVQYLSVYSHLVKNVLLNGRGHRLGAYKVGNDKVSKKNTCLRFVGFQREYHRKLGVVRAHCEKWSCREAPVASGLQPCLIGKVHVSIDEGKFFVDK